MLIFAPVPKTQKHFSWKQEPPFWGLFSGTFVRFLPFFAIWCDFSIFHINIFKTIHALTKMPSKKFRKLPSAARFCAKRFRHIDFWTFFLSIS